MRHTHPLLQAAAALMLAVLVVATTPATAARADDPQRQWFVSTIEGSYLTAPNPYDPTPGFTTLTSDEIDALFSADLLADVIVAVEGYPDLPFPERDGWLLGYVGLETGEIAGCDVAPYEGSVTYYAEFPGEEPADFDWHAFPPDDPHYDAIQDWLEHDPDGDPPFEFTYQDFANIDIYTCFETLNDAPSPSPVLDAGLSIVGEPVVRAEARADGEPLEGARVDFVVRVGYTDGSYVASLARRFTDSDGAALLDVTEVVSVDQALTIAVDADIYRDADATELIGSYSVTLAPALTPDPEPTPDHEPTPDGDPTPDHEPTPDRDPTPDHEPTPDRDSTPEPGTTPGTGRAVDTPTSDTVPIPSAVVPVPTRVDAGEGPAGRSADVFCSALVAALLLLVASRLPRPAKRR